MERNEFLKMLGTASLMACAGCALESCSSSDPTVPAPPTGVDFTIDLTSSANTALTADGGSIYKNGLVIVRISDTSYIALSQACTHQGTTVAFQPSAGNFLCSNHGSRFSTTGSVINGPAASSLKRYNTELTGTDLRVFS
ncbi:MAG: Rieske (2Fe-2S) protein [Cyclobacteriaceae bacterium]|nr:Rieske (2Fe-2S) protein [Cyclobacteriaceae bacterium]